MRTIAIALLFALSAAIAPAAHAQSIAGEWDASINTPGGARPYKITFIVKGDSLSGVVKRSAGDVPLIGIIKGDAVAFNYTVEYNGNGLTLTVHAKIVGDDMTGTVDFGGQAEDSFSAKRVAKAKP